MDVIWCKLCVNMILRKGDLFVLSTELGKCATNEAGKYLCRAANVWWRCAQYFVIVSSG